MSAHAVVRLLWPTEHELEPELVAIVDRYLGGYRRDGRAVVLAELAVVDRARAVALLERDTRPDKTRPEIANEHVTAPGERDTDPDNFPAAEVVEHGERLRTLAEAARAAHVDYFHRDEPPRARRGARRASTAARAAQIAARRAR